MGLEVWFSDDILRVLRAIRVAGQAARSEEQAMIGPDPVLDAYWCGYKAAPRPAGQGGLASVGEAFGVREGLGLAEADNPPVLIAPRRPGLVIDYPLPGTDGKER